MISQERQSSPDDEAHTNFVVDSYLAIDKITIPLDKKISKDNSKLICDVIERFKINKQVSWGLVMNCFVVPEDQKVKFLDKLRYHYYNKTAKDKRINERKSKNFWKKFIVNYQRFIMNRNK